MSVFILLTTIGLFFPLPFHTAGWRMDGWWQKRFSGWLAHGHVRGTAPPGNAIYCQHASAGTALLVCRAVKLPTASNIQYWAWLNTLGVSSDTEIKAKGLSVKSRYYMTVHNFISGTKVFWNSTFCALPLTTQFLEIPCHCGHWEEYWVDRAGRELIYRISYLMCIHSLPKPGNPNGQLSKMYTRGKRQRKNFYMTNFMQGHRYGLIFSIILLWLKQFLSFCLDFFSKVFWNSESSVASPRCKETRSHFGTAGELDITVHWSGRGNIWKCDFYPCCCIGGTQTSGSSEKDIHSRLWARSPFLWVLNNILFI